MTAANASTGYVRRNITGIAMPRTNGMTTSVFAMPSFGMPAPG